MQPITRKLTAALLLVAVLLGAALLILKGRDFSAPEAERLPYEDLRPPVTNPPLESDRPDLLEEPRIREAEDEPLRR